MKNEESKAAALEAWRRYRDQTRGLPPRRQLRRREFIAGWLARDSRVIVATLDDMLASMRQAVEAAEEQARTAVGAMPVATTSTLDAAAIGARVAAPLIEDVVREQVAREIEAAMTMADPVRSATLATAARIARGKQR